MSTKPIFVATHPRACSTAFERVFMTRQDTLTCVHEPFGDAFYFGPERLSDRYEDDAEAREASGFAGSTFKSIFDRIERESHEGKRLFIKDITHYLVPPNGKPASIAPSLGGKRVKKGVGTNGDVSLTNGHANGNTTTPNNITNGTHGDHALTNGHTKDKIAPYPYDTDPEPGNPTVVPAEILKQFHFTFLIRHPQNSIPSYFRCTIPPLDKVTGFYDFMPSEAGYDELRRVFDFLRSQSQVGPAIAGQPSAPLSDGQVSITVIDADDMLDDPEGVIRAYCREVGIEFQPDMLTWDTDESYERAKAAFEKWRGFHDDAIESTSLRPREHKKKIKDRETQDQEWREKYGEQGQKVIREAVEANLADYEYLKSFAVKA